MGEQSDVYIRKRWTSRMERKQVREPKVNNNLLSLSMNIYFMYLKIEFI